MKNKYNARKVKDDGYTFDSKAEHRRYCELKLLQAAGEISSLRVHPKYELMPGFTDWTGKRQRNISYIADFEYLEQPSMNLVVEDVKSKPTMTPVFRLKKKLFLKAYPGFELRIVK